MSAILITLWNLPVKLKLIIVGFILALAGIGYVTHLSRQARIAEKQTKDAQIEANRQMQKADGLQILINADQSAGEIQNDKKLANAQAVNSNAAVNDFNFSVNRDSGTFSNNYSEARRRFCERFPEDGKCR